MAPRWVPLAALVANLIAFILAFLVLLGDINNISETLQKDAIMTYNVSYIGRDPDHYAPDLAAHIKDLVPQVAQNGPSVTSFLGIYDWYAMYHFYICKGWYDVDPATRLLTDTKVNAVCERRPQSYIFNLHDALAATMDPTVSDLANDLPDGLIDLNAKVPTAFLIMGIILLTFNFVTLPFAITGRFRVNKCAWGISYLAMFIFMVAGIYDTVVAKNAQNRDIADLCSSFLGMLWAAFAMVVVEVALTQLELNYEAWTPRGQPITIYRKPKDSGWWWAREKHHERLSHETAERTV
jgi:hypothetical protein